MMNRVKLGNVVQRIKEYVNKDTTDLVFYIGGEHFDYGSVKITKRAEIKGSTIGPAFRMKFHPNDVLLMSRNPHLKKAGMVNFEGVCSDVSYVCRTKSEDVLMQSYLPFIFQSDDFWEFAESNKKGSTNFFLNWSDFEKYEFDLPSKERQEELCKLLWTGANLKESYTNLLYNSNQFIKANFLELFGNPVTNSFNWETDEMMKVAPEKNANLDEQDKYWLLNLDKIEQHTGKIIEKVYVKKSDIGASTSTFDTNMVLYSKLRPYLNKVVIPDEPGYATTELVGLMPIPEKLNKVFLAYLLRSDEFVDHVVRLSGGARMPRTPMKEFRKFKCILPPTELQIKFENFALEMENTKIQICEAIFNIDSSIKMFVANK